MAKRSGRRRLVSAGKAGTAVLGAMKDASQGARGAPAMEAPVDFNIVELAGLAPLHQEVIDVLRMRIVRAGALTE
jgi:hypothetical protein